MAYVPVCDRVAGTYENVRTGSHHILVNPISIRWGGGGLSLPRKLVLTKIFDIPASLFDVQFGNDNTCRVPPLDPVEHVVMGGFDPTDIWLNHFILW